jgi:diguanylate cyclase (GGDEF)-like protein
MSRNRTRAGTDAEVTGEDLRAARQRLDRSVRFALPISISAQLVVLLLAGMLVVLVAPGLRGMELVAAVAVTSTAITLPLVGLITRVAKGRSLEQLGESMARERQLRTEARRREFESRLTNALEMAETEAEAMTAASRALGAIAPATHVEILLADNSHAHLERALVCGPDPHGAGCSVESPDRCVAARRGQTQVFDDSDALDACPKLQDRSIGRCHAACVPVSIMGRTVGVVHLAAPLEDAISDTTVDELEIVANQVGARVGMVRMMSESQLQASTDGLTGLANRRSFENRVRELRNSGGEFSVVMADLDNFKAVNDTHGHEAGDRALRVFSTVLRSTVRPVDIACRYGGEEFVLVLPDCDANEARLVCERLRDALDLATRQGGSPGFTASFGIVASTPDVSLEQLVARADTALYDAKRSGRNRAVIWNQAAPADAIS